MANWRKTMLSVIKGPPKIGMKGMSIALGMGETGVRDVLERNQEPSIRKFVKMASYLGLTPSTILEDGEGPTISIPIVGESGAGEEWIPIDDHAQGASVDTVEFSLGGVDPIGIRIRGESMLPVYRPGDIIVASRMQGANIENALNRDCVVRTLGGESYLKVLRRGARRGLFTLRSYNPSHQDLEDVALDWAAPVRWVRRA